MVRTAADRVDRMSGPDTLRGVKTSMVVIEICQRGELPRQVPLSSRPFILGRSDDTDFKVSDPFVSGRNTQVSLQVLVTDLGSRNGTWVGEEQIEEKAIGLGESVTLGREENVRFRVLIAEDASLPKTDAGGASDGALQERVTALQDELAERNRELGELRRMIDESGYGRANEDGEEESRVAQLERELEERDQQVARLRAASQASEGTAQELQVLRARVEELEDQIGDAEEAARAAEARVALGARSVTTAGESGGDSGGEVLEEALDAFLGNGADLEPALLQTILSRRDVAGDLGFALGKMYRFGRDVEKVVTRIAQQYRGGGDLDQTMLPGMAGLGGNLSRSVNGLLLKGGADRRGELEEYLRKIRVWWYCLLASQPKAVAQWYENVLERISPQKIERETAVSGLAKLAGLETKMYWKQYRNLMEDLTHDIAMDEIENITAELAVKHAEKEGVK